MQQPEQIKKQIKLKLLKQSQFTSIYLKDEGQNIQQSVIKLVKHKANCHTHHCQNLKNEFKILIQLKHPNIIKLKEYGFFEQSSGFCSSQNQKIDESKNDTYCCLNIEKCQFDLFQVLKKSYPYIVPLKQIKEWFTQIASALNYLHEEKKVLHLDIKLENILISTKNTAKITDFGTSLQQKDLENIESVKNSFRNRNPDYFSPEALSLSNVVDENDDEEVIKFLKNQIDWQAIDLFAFGVTFFNSIFLSSPFSDTKGHNFHLKDQQYQYIFKKDYQGFWQSNKQFEQIFQSFKKQGVSNQELELLQDLIQQMIAYSPQDRIQSFKLVLEHPWFK